MTIKDIVRTAAVLLDRTDIKDYLDGNFDGVAEETTQSLTTLTELANLVISELAESYIPAVKSEEVFASNNRIYYSTLSEKPLKILKVKDGFDNPIRFSYSPEYILTDRQNVIVEYEYLPTAKSLEDDICYSEREVSPRIIAYGLAAEYSIVMGEFNQAVTWHKRYTDGIATICLPENKNLKARSFV